MSVKSLRSTQRILHLVAGAALLTFVYAGVEAPTVVAAVRFVVIPLVALSGLVMWFAPRIVRARRTRSLGVQGRTEGP